MKYLFTLKYIFCTMASYAGLQEKGGGQAIKDYQAYPPDTSQNRASPLPPDNPAP